MRLSRYFGVSVDEMLSETELPHLQNVTGVTFPTAETELLENFRKLTETGKARVAAYVDFVVQQEADARAKKR